MFTKKHFASTLQWLIAVLTISLLLPACSAANSSTTLPNPTATSAPAVTVEPTATTAPIVPTATVVPTTTDDLLDISLETGGMATGFQTETVAAVPASDNAPYWEVLPEYTRVTLEGYPVSSPGTPSRQS